MASAIVPGRAYLESPVRIATILGSFAVLCVPLAAAQLLISSLALRTLAVGIYAVLLGTTHFVVTLGVYLNSRNLRYFASSPRNVAIYFIAPLALFSAFFAIGFFGLHDPTNASAVLPRIPVLVYRARQGRRLLPRSQAELWRPPVVQGTSAVSIASLDADGGQLLLPVDGWACSCSPFSMACAAAASRLR